MMFSQCLVMFLVAEMCGAICVGEDWMKTKRIRTPHVCYRLGKSKRSYFGAEGECFKDGATLFHSAKSKAELNEFVGEFNHSYWIGIMENKTNKPKWDTPNGLKDLPDFLVCDENCDRPSYQKRCGFMTKNIRDIFTMRRCSKEMKFICVRGQGTVPPPKQTTRPVSPAMSTEPPEKKLSALGVVGITFLCLLGVAIFVCGFGVFIHIRKKMDDEEDEDEDEESGTKVTKTITKTAAGTSMGTNLKSYFRSGGITEITGKGKKGKKGKKDKKSKTGKESAKTKSENTMASKSAASKTGASKSTASRFIDSFITAKPEKTSKVKK